MYSITDISSGEVIYSKRHTSRNYTSIAHVTYYYLEGGLRDGCMYPSLSSHVVSTNFGGLAVLVGPDSPASSPRCHLAPLGWIGNVAVGSEAHALDTHALMGAGVTHILNLTEAPPEPRSQFTTKHLPMRDTLSQDMLSCLTEALPFIGSADARRVFVHAGISRSVSVTIAYVMWSARCSLAEAQRTVFESRRCAEPNLNFMGQLYVFEQARDKLGSTGTLQEVCDAAKAILSAYGT